jgi:hypothetical protein
MANRFTRGRGLFGSVTVGGGSNIAGIASGTVSVDFGSVSANTTGSKTVTITGVADGDVVVLNPGALTAGLAFAGAAVTAANTVTVYAVNTTGSAIDNAAVDFDYLWFDLT